MTRLTEEMMRPITAGLREYEARMLSVCGLDCVGVAALAGGSVRPLRVAAVPITAGLGVIGGFAEAVAAIVRAAGSDCFVTERADVDGIYEAVTRGAEVIFMADDDRYIAVRTADGRVADNNVWTSRGFVRALDVASPVKGRRAAVLGCGIIGRGAAEELARLGAELIMYDSDASRLADCGYAVMADISELKAFDLVFDATNTGGWLTADMLSPAAVIAAPGVPLSLNAADARALASRLMHDDLETGTLLMLGALM